MKTIEHQMELSEPIEGQISTEQASTEDKTRKTLLYKKLQPFDAQHSSYDRERHLQLCSKGGSVKGKGKGGVKALVRLLTRQRFEFATVQCKVNYRTALEFYRMLMSVDDYNTFVKSEIFELLSLLRNEFNDLLEGTGTGKMNIYTREKMIAAKIREIELLCKFGKMLFPELKDSAGFTLNYLRSDTPLDGRNLRLVSPLTPEARLDAPPSSSGKPSRSAASGSEKVKSSKVISNE